MNKYFKLLVAAMILVGWCARGADRKSTLLLEMKDKLDNYDATLRNRNINNNDMQEWWRIADDFIFRLFNKNSTKGRPLDYLFQEMIIPEGVALTGSTEKGATIYYSYSCGPHGAPHEFGIHIIQLTSDRQLFYISYGKSWWDYPNCEGDHKSGGRIFLIEKNQKSGQYEITARFEETNFYQDLVLTGKLGKMVGIEGDPYGSTGALETAYDPITSVNGEIRFNTDLTNCMPGGPSCHQMYLYWVYDKNKKLRCLFYLDDYELEKDPRTGKLRPMGIKVELAP